MPPALRQGLLWRACCVAPNQDDQEIRITNDRLGCGDNPTLNCGDADFDEEEWDDRIPDGYTYTGHEFSSPSSRRAKPRDEELAWAEDDLEVLEAVLLAAEQQVLAGGGKWSPSLYLRVEGCEGPGVWTSSDPPSRKPFAVEIHAQDRSEQTGWTGAGEGLALHVGPADAREPLEVRVIGADGTVLGSANLNLAPLQDQEVRRWRSVVGAGNDRVRLDLAAQWVHDRTALFQSHVEMLRERIAAQKPRTQPEVLAGRAKPVRGCR